MDDTILPDETDAHADTRPGLALISPLINIHGRLDLGVFWLFDWQLGLLDSIGRLRICSLAVSLSHDTHTHVSVPGCNTTNCEKGGEYLSTPPYSCTSSQPPQVFRVCVISTSAQFESVSAAGSFIILDLELHEVCEAPDRAFLINIHTRRLLSYCWTKPYNVLFPSRGCVRCVLQSVKLLVFVFFF